MPKQDTIDALYAQANAPVFLPTSNTGGDNIELMDVCMAPLMRRFYFIGGGTPKENLDKTKIMFVSVSPGNRGLYKFISRWGRYACVVSGPFGAEVNNSSVVTTWRDFPRGVECNSWAKARFRAVYRMAGPPPSPAAAPASDQHVRMA